MNSAQLNSLNLVGKLVHLSEYAILPEDPILGPGYVGCAWGFLETFSDTKYAEEKRKVLDAVYKITGVEGEEFIGLETKKRLESAHHSERFWIFAEKVSGIGPEQMNGLAYEFIILPD